MDLEIKNQTNFKIVITKFQIIADKTATNQEDEECEDIYIIKK